MNKKGIIAANWKMNFTLQEALSFFESFTVPTNCNHRVIIAPQFPLLSTIKTFTQKMQIELAAQNCASEKKGAFTGETSTELLASLGVESVILGHSERRQYFAEEETLLSKKIQQCLEQNLSVIFCIGETLKERQSGLLESTLIKQLTCLKEFAAKNLWHKLIIAYEPVWAIGTGQVATLEQVQEVHGFIQSTFKSNYPGTSVPPILYGGSVNPANAQDLFKLPAVAGFLVGGASLKPKDFATILSVQ
jgi:triosephosphate isomerase